jgi:hypothetical protein
MIAIAAMIFSKELRALFDRLTKLFSNKSNQEVLYLRTVFETFGALLKGYLGTKQTEKSLQDTFFFQFLM